MLSSSIFQSILRLFILCQYVQGGGIFTQCHADYQSFGYSPLFSEYKIVINNLFIAKDDHDVEDSEGDEKDEGDESEEL